MKTTIELPDELAAQARQCAAAEGTTLRSLLEEALRRELERRTTVSVWAPDPDLAFGAQGLTAEAAAKSWSEIRELAMER